MYIYISLEILYSIVEIKTVSPSGLRKSDIQQLNNKEWQINITWTPDINQFGIHLFCFQAIESTGYDTMYNYVH